jgi:HK97 gp10 family phage protein
VAGRVTIKGLNELHAKLKRLPGILEAAGERAVKAEVDEVVQDMRRNAPVDTGELKAGIQGEYDSSSVTGKAVSTARHTPFVVHGTSETPANDFMTPAAERARRRFPKRVETEINREIGKIT